MTTIATRRPAVPDRALPWAGLLAVLALFELLARTELINPRFFPPVSEMIARLAEEAGTGGFWSAVGNTLQGWALGLGIACAIAVPVGIVVGSSPLLYRALRGVIEFLRPIPSVALIPLAVLVYGSGLESKVFLAAFAATWPLLIQSIYGVRDLDPVQRETARSFGIPLKDRLFKVSLPAAIPYIATGLRISSATALVLAVTAELVIGAPGLGRAINTARAGGVPDLMYALTIATGLLGWGLNVVLSWVERRALHWHPSHREVAR
jgi:ABC-type nitrate/sulfonate/bicarbonate transport system permease component